MSELSDKELLELYEILKKFVRNLENSKETPKDDK